MENDSKSNVTGPNLDQHEGAAFLPFSHLHDFMRFLAFNNSFVKTRSYSELDWAGNFNPETMYQGEKDTWTNNLSSNGMKKTIQVFVQFDVDSEPQVSMEIIEKMMEIGVTASVMIFNKRVNRNLLKNTGQVELTDYPIDDDLLRAAEAKGFTIGYHCNAMERASYDKNRALEIFEEDISELRQRFPTLKLFSPHGGVPSAEGLNNISLPVTEEIQKRLDIRWVHNQRAPKFKTRFSDGGFVNPNLEPNRLDLRKFVQKWSKGKRYRVLIHPQYYNAETMPLVERAPRVINSEWFRELWEAYHPQMSGESGKITHNGSNSMNSYWGDLKWRSFRGRLLRGKFL